MALTLFIDYRATYTLQREIHRLVRAVIELPTLIVPVRVVFNWFNGHYKSTKKVFPRKKWNYSINHII